MKRFLAVLAAVVVTGLLFVPAVAYADVNDFAITDFTVDYYLSKDDPQGQMNVVERLNVDFTDQNHGILRALPRRYKYLPLNIKINRVSSDSGAPAQYTTSSDSNGNEIIKIGDPNQTVTGKQEYTINYTLQNVINFQPDHDELYWDVNGTEWMQDFDHITARVHIPPGLHFARESVCYQGPEGTTAHDCTVSQLSDVLTVSAGPVYQRDALTFVAAFPKGYFLAPTWQDYVIGYVPPVIEFLVPVLLIGGAGFVWWLKRGRDAKGTGIIVPQYDAPDNLTPLEVGALLDFDVRERDLTATVIDLAIRKYIRIVEQDKKLLGIANKKDFAIELLNADWTGLNSWERELMSGMFGMRGQLKTVLLSDMAHQLHGETVTIKKSVVSSLTDRGYFRSNPTLYIHFSIFAVVIIAVYFVLHAPVRIWTGTWMWGLIVGAIIFGIFFHFLAARTAKGVAAREHALGLKLYLEVAEKDRIKMLQSPDAPYAAKTGEPVQTVDLFEKLLPYAIVLKVERQWAKKFENIYSTPPNWYVGNYAAFNTGYLVGSLSGGFSSAIGSSFGASTSGSGSGFGGGFAGGGGGGGGGGGW